MSFIDSINANLFCFPSSLVWLVNQLYSIVSRRNTSSSSSSSSIQHDVIECFITITFLNIFNLILIKKKTARKLCCDMIMALYICPAICDPEPYGVVTDVQISTVARHNLMQVNH